MPHYWLMKSEPDIYSIDDLKQEKKAFWDGVRNYQARNYMRDHMKKGDGVLFYHSNADPPGIAGVARVCKEAYADPTQWDKKSEHYEPRASKGKPVWMMVDIEFVEKFSTYIPLDVLRQTPSLEGMLVLKRGMRLSILPVETRHFNTVGTLGRKTGLLR